MEKMLMQVWMFVRIVARNYQESHTNITMNMEETKKCPYCGNEILAVAKKCKHCGKWLEAKDSHISLQPNAGVDNPKKSQETNAFKLFMPVAIIIVVGIILVIAIQFFFKNNNGTSQSPTITEETYSNPTNEEIEEVEREIQDAASDKDDYNEFVIE